MTLQLTDASGKVKIYRNALHKFGASNPFTLASLTLLAGLIIGAIFL